MDIDVISRLQHEEYLAERDYRIIGSMNAYGLSLADAKDLHQRFEKASREWLHAGLVLRNYIMGETLAGAINKASYTMSYSQGQPCYQSPSVDGAQRYPEPLRRMLGISY